MSTFEEVLGDQLEHYDWRAIGLDQYFPHLQASSDVAKIALDMANSYDNEDSALRNWVEGLGDSEGEDNAERSELEDLKEAWLRIQRCTQIFSDMYTGIGERVELLKTMGYEPIVYPEFVADVSMQQVEAIRRLDYAEHVEQDLLEFNAQLTEAYFNETDLHFQTV